MNNKDKKLCDKIVSLLKTKNMFYDVEVSNGIITVTIENGDWKHDHISFMALMKSYGYIFISRNIVDEDNGDDSFSATYLYMEEV